MAKGTLTHLLERLPGPGIKAEKQGKGAVGLAGLRVRCGFLVGSPRIGAAPFVRAHGLQGYHGSRRETQHLLLAVGSSSALGIRLTRPPRVDAARFRACSSFTLL